MTPRERWLAILNRQSYDRIPLDYRATPEFTSTLIDYLDCGDYASMLQRLHIDPVLGVGPRYVGPPLELNKDAFGVGYLDFDYGMGTYHEAVSHPLARYATVEEIEADYHWPLADWWDYSGIPDQVKGHEDWVIQG
ncbi:MAG: uroporphyrinogen-III decarboxylase-like protein, partial [Bacteroidota bacterium]